VLVEAVDNVILVGVQFLVWQKSVDWRQVQQIQIKYHGQIVDQFVVKLLRQNDARFVQERFEVVGQVCVEPRVLPYLWDGDAFEGIDD